MTTGHQERHLGARSDTTQGLEAALPAVLPEPTGASRILHPWAAPCREAGR
jgi:hypothetical protein